MRVLSRSRHWWALSRSGHWRAPIEEQAPEGAIEERALEGAFEELSLEGALKAQAQQSAFKGLVLEHALGWSELRPAGLREPQMTAGMTSEPWTAAGLFWLGVGHSPDIGGSLSSSSICWCLGGPRDNDSWPHTRKAKGWWRNRMPSPR